MLLTPVEHNPVGPLGSSRPAAPPRPAFGPAGLAFGQTANLAPTLPLPLSKAQGLSDEKGRWHHRRNSSKLRLCRPVSSSCPKPDHGWTLLSIRIDRSDHSRHLDLSGKVSGAQTRVNRVIRSVDCDALEYLSVQIRAQSPSDWAATKRWCACELSWCESVCV